MKLSTVIKIGAACIIGFTLSRNGHGLATAEFWIIAILVAVVAIAAQEEVS
jgi:hypothetical protein